MRGAIALLITLALLASAAPALAAPEKRPDAPPTPEGKQRGEAHKPSAIGDFNVQASRVTGDFVTLTYTETSLDGFTVDGIELFDLHVAGVAPGDQDAKGARTDGAQVRIRTGSYDLRSHDNPEAVTKIETDGILSLHLAPGAILKLDGPKRGTFALGDLTGTFRGDDLAITGTTLTAKDKLLLFLDKPHGAYDVHRTAIGKAIGRGHVGAEASFNHREDGLKQDVVSYGNVTMRTLKAEMGNLTVEVEGHGTEGRVLVLNVDGRVIGASHADKLLVTIDGIPVQHEGSLATLLDPDADGMVPVYHLVFDPAEEAFQLLVRVPHYSVHTLSVTTLLELAPPSVIVGILAGVALLVPSALLLFRRK